MTLRLGFKTRWQRLEAAFCDYCAPGAALADRENCERLGCVAARLRRAIEHERAPWPAVSSNGAMSFSQHH